MTIDFQSLTPSSDDFSKRASSRRNSLRMSSSEGKAPLSISHISSGSKWYLAGAGGFVMLLLFVWLMLYSFKPKWVRFSRSSGDEAQADPMKALGWGLLITTVLSLLALMWGKYAGMGGY